MAKSSKSGGGKGIKRDAGTGRYIENRSSNKPKTTVVEQTKPSGSDPVKKGKSK